MKRIMKQCLVLLLCLLPWTAGALELTEETIFDPIPVDGAALYAPLPEGFLPEDGGYHDASLDIRVETFRMHDTTVMEVRVKLMDPSQLRTALAARPPSKKTMIVSSMARKNNAVLAINGDYFSYHDKGVVVRNGRQIRNRATGKRDVLIIDDEGDFSILYRCTKADYMAVAERTRHAFCFGPGLVIDGRIPQHVANVDMDIAQDKPTQRMAIGQTGPLEYLILATEGPENKGSVGFTIQQMADLCLEKGCINAYNLDGGSSSTIVLNNRKINSLSAGKVRPVGDCIYFATLVPDTKEK